MKKDEMLKLVDLIESDLTLAKSGGTLAKRHSAASVTSINAAKIRLDGLEREIRAFECPEVPDPPPDPDLMWPHRPYDLPTIAEEPWNSIPSFTRPRDRLWKTGPGDQHLSTIKAPGGDRALRMTMPVNFKNGSSPSVLFAPLKGIRRLYAATYLTFSDDIEIHPNGHKAWFNLKFIGTNLNMIDGIRQDEGGRYYYKIGANGNQFHMGLELVAPSFLIPNKRNLIEIELDTDTGRFRCYVNRTLTHRSDEAEFPQDGLNELTLMYVWGGNPIPPLYTTRSWTWDHYITLLAGA